jgi:hypothetical protein
MMVSRILDLTLYSEIPRVPPSVSAGVGLEASSWGVVMIAGVVAASAFLRARSRSQVQLAWMRQREGMLGVATSALAVAFLLGAIGTMIIAGQGAGKGSTARWLEGIGEVGLMVAAASASVAFFLSRSSSAVRRH